MSTASLFLPLKHIARSHLTNDEPFPQAIHGYQALLNLFPLPCLLFDAAGQFLLCNDTFERLFPHADRLTHIHNLSAHLAFSGQWPPPLETNQASSLLSARAKSNNKLYTIQYTRGVLNGDTDTLLLCIHEHIDEQQVLFRQHDMHERLLHAARTQSVGEMTTILSHELNQPLGSILNCLDAAKQMLGSVPQVPSRAHDALRLAQIQASQAVAVVARIREFVASRETRFEPCGIHTVITLGLERLQWELLQHNVQLCTEIADNLPIVRIDPVMLGQVFSNVVQNSIDAMKDNATAAPTLSITATLDLDQRIVVRISDNGVGMTLDQQAKIFTPFFTTKLKGMGIGLSICRSIMELHGGSLYFESKPRCGSTFCFTLPT